MRWFCLRPTAKRGTRAPPRLRPLWPATVSGWHRLGCASVQFATKSKRSLSTVATQNSWSTIRAICSTLDRCNFGTSNWSAKRSEPIWSRWRNPERPTRRGGRPLACSSAPNCCRNDRAKTFLVEDSDNSRRFHCHRSWRAVLGDSCCEPTDHGNGRDYSHVLKFPKQLANVVAQSRRQYRGRGTILWRWPEVPAPPLWPTAEDRVWLRSRWTSCKLPLLWKSKELRGRRRWRGRRELRLWPNRTCSSTIF